MEFIGVLCKNDIVLLYFIILILDKNLIFNIFFGSLKFLLNLNDFWIVDGNFVNIEEDVLLDIQKIIFFDFMNNVILNVLVF